MTETACCLTDWFGRACLESGAADVRCVGERFLMSFKQTVLTLAAGSVLILLSAPAFSQLTQAAAAKSTTASTPAEKLSVQYSAFAGSPSNARALITGLREDKPVTLVANPDGPQPTAPSATFAPATSKLGYGSINIALSLAKADLARQGINHPTPEQLAAALNGGTLGTATGSVTMAGVLTQRQAGLGWGQIAKTMGVTLGSVVSASKTAKAGAKVDKPESMGKSQAKEGKSESAGKGGNGGKGGDGGGNGGGGGKK